MSEQRFIQIEQTDYRVAPKVRAEILRLRELVEIAYERGKAAERDRIVALIEKSIDEFGQVPKAKAAEVPGE